MKSHVNSYHHKINDLMKLISDDETLSVLVLSLSKAILDFTLLFQSFTLSSLINLTLKALSRTKKIRSLSFTMMIKLRH